MISNCFVGTYKLVSDKWSLWYEHADEVASQLKDLFGWLIFNVYYNIQTLPEAIKRKKL